MRHPAFKHCLLACVLASACQGSAGEPDTGTNHLGFRCVKDVGTNDRK